MTRSSDRDIYFSFFMFTVDLRPTDPEYTKGIIRHIEALRELGYAGFDLPIAPPSEGTDPGADVESYRTLRQALDDAGLGDVRFTTNVGATQRFDPSSPDEATRESGLRYLKSRVDITKALRGDIMAGPIVLPYGVYPMNDASETIWSDALGEWLIPRYQAAQPILERLAEYAADQDVKLAIEPVDHWEQPAPTLVQEVMDFLENVRSRQIGVCIDSAHVVLGSEGPAAFTRAVRRALDTQRLHYVHISAPDRGAVHDSWIPWKPFLEPILEGYDGPFLVEVFNAIPVFLNPLRLTRRKFWIEGEDNAESDYPDAYEIARQAIAALRRELSETRKNK